MSRIARIVVPGIPHHVTQRGNFCQDVFPDDKYRRRYLELLSSAADEHGIAIWAWCLMINHVHLVAVPGTEGSLARGMEAVHGQYARELNRHFARTGHLWQARYYSAPLDDEHLIAAVRYVELNPVRAGIVANAWDYPWSSARARLGLPGSFTAPHLQRLPSCLDSQIRDWRAFLARETASDLDAAIRNATRMGLPAATGIARQRISEHVGRTIEPRPRGRPRRSAA